MLKQLAIHPAVDQLRAFHSGQLADEAASAAVAEHLELCEQCRATMQSFAGDSFEALVRDAATTGKALEETYETANTELDLRNARPPLKPRDRIGDCRIVRQLGAGGMGIVFEAEDERLKRRVAIKLPKPELAANAQAKARFLREAQLAASLDHDHIMTVHQVGEENGVPYLVMPLLKGVSLDQRLKTGAPFTPQETIRFGIQVASGLAAAHAQALIHRDIKPANLWLESDKDSRVKILDFGLARLAEHDSELTQAGTIVGTPGYLAPEQARGEPVDARADLFSLGCVLYRMCTGSLPFAGDTTMAVLTALATEHPTAPHTLNPEIPTTLSDLVMRLLAKQPEDRPATAQEVVRELEACVQPQTTFVVATARPATAEPTTSDAVRTSARFDARRGSRAVAAITAALLLGAAAIGLFQLLFSTPNGTLIVDVDADADVRFRQGKLAIYENGDLKYTLEASARNKSLPPGKYLVQVTGADGLTLETNTFELKKRGERHIRVMVDSKAGIAQNAGAGKPTVPTVTPDREAAEWALKNGARIEITVDGVAQSLEGDPAQLPAQPLRLTAVAFSSTEVRIPQMTREGLRQIAAMRNLESLAISAPLADEAFAEISSLRLARLIVLSDQLTDAGLVHLRELPLKQLGLHGCRITDAGLAQLKEHRDLEFLELADTLVTDGGLALIADFPQLRELGLVGAFTDTGLSHLSKLRNLARLDVVGTKFSENALREFQKAVPHCFVNSDFGAFGPVALEPPGRDRDVAKWFLEHGGKVWILADGATSTIQGDAAQLPATSFEVTGVEVTFSAVPASDITEQLLGLNALTALNLLGTPISDGYLKRLADKAPFRERLHILHVGPDLLTSSGVDQISRFHNLTTLDLRLREPGQVLGHQLAKLSKLKRLSLFAPITDKDLEAIKSLSLDSLHIQGAGLTDALFQHLTAMPLVSLELTGCQITDGGIKQLAQLERLRSLGLVDTTITDAGLEAVAQLPNLVQLGLQGPYTDTGIKHLTRAPQLVYLSLFNSDVTDAGAADLAQMQSLEGLTLQRAKVSDVALKHFERLANLTHLDLLGTSVTIEAVQRFRKAVPNCGVVSDVGTFGPLAAEAVETGKP